MVCMANRIHVNTVREMLKSGAAVSLKFRMVRLITVFEVNDMEIFI
jgi:hypothetical protein